jgi:hypothetical protein
MTFEPCGAPIRGIPGATCKLPKGHPGRRADSSRGARPGHSCVVFTCDSCGRTLRGTPHDVLPDGGPPWWDDPVGTLNFCFLCIGYPYRQGGAHREVNPDNPYDRSIL